ncbi:MAG: HPr kinase/phosphatase C-terminal domain-containing protein [Hyphomicrobiaceae bacterium]
MSQQGTHSRSLLVHATSVALGHRAALIRGPSGSGKSDLALRFLSNQATLAGIDHPRCLIADDQTELQRDGHGLIVRCPATISGKIEVRGIGIVPMNATLTSARLALIIDLVTTLADVSRYPMMDKSDVLLGVAIPCMPFYPFEASAPLKLALALELAE